MEMKDIEFTIIMPVYNSEKYLGESIKSILSQTYQSFQLLLIDDGSTDSSGKICDMFSKQHNNIAVYHKRNGGICSARNYGLERARGEYVYFMDNDDILKRNALEVMNQALKENNTDILMFGSCLTNIEKEEVTSTIDRVMEEFMTDTRAELREKIPVLLENGMLLCVWDKAYKTEFLIRSGVKFNPFFTHGGEDLDFNLQLIKQIPRLKNIQQVLYEYYIRDIQSTYRKFNDNVYVHSIRNLKALQDILTRFELKDSKGYIYMKYVEYRLRLLFMLGHSQINLKKKEKIQICKNELNNDGYSISFRSKALFYYLIYSRESFKKKILVTTCFLHLYRISIEMIDVFKRKKK